MNRSVVKWLGIVAISASLSGSLSGKTDEALSLALFIGGGIAYTLADVKDRSRSTEPSTANTCASCDTHQRILAGLCTRLGRLEDRVRKNEDLLHVDDAERDGIMAMLYGCGDVTKYAFTPKRVSVKTVVNLLMARLRLKIERIPATDQGVKLVKESSKGKAVGRG